MTTTTPSVPEQERGFFGKFRKGFRSGIQRLFNSGAGSGSHGHGYGNAGDFFSEHRGSVVIAPGGFRIHVAKPSDASAAVDVTSLDALVPEVRDGLKLLPPLPNIVLQLLREIQSASSTASSVADIASSDPSLAASLLRAVNSAGFGLSHKVTNVPQAVSLLGFTAVRSLVVRFRLANLIPHRSEQASADSEDIWTHCLAVSYIASALAQRVPEVDKGFVATVGLLHDIGRLVLCAQHPNFAEAIRKAGTSSDSLLQKEATAFGADHSAVGAMLGNRWQLPADLNAAIRWHHFPQRAFEASDPIALRKAAHLIYISDQLAKYCYSYSDDMEIDLPAEESLENLRLGGSLPELLDAKVRTAATQAILFADETSKCPLSVVRPFLKLRRGGEGVEIVRRVQEAPDAQVSEGAAGAELIEVCESCFTFDASRPAPGELAGHTQARYSAPASIGAADWVVRSFDAHVHKAGVTPRTAGCARAVLRGLLPNLLSTAAPMDIAWQWENPTFYLVVRSDAISFANRLPAGTSTSTGRKALDAELANIANLAWFDIETSADGATLLFRSR